MPIEFRCGQCGKLLRTGDDTAGKQAKCPSCGSIQAIPMASQGAAPAPGAFPPLPSGLPDNPFAAQPSAPAMSPFGDVPPAIETMNPYQSPGHQVSQAPYPDGPTVGRYRPTQIDIGNVLSKSWEVFKANYWNCVGVFVITGLVNYAVQFGEQIVVGILAQVVRNVAITLTIHGILVTALIVFQFWISIGQALFLLKLTRHGEGDYGAIFAGGPYLVRLILAYLIVFALVLAVSLACAIPAVIAGFGTKEPGIGVAVFFLFALFPFMYLSLAFSPCNYLIVDQGLGPVEAIRASLEVTKGNKLSIFAIALVAGLFGLLGILGCGIGILFTMPFAPLTITVMYLSMTGQSALATNIHQR